MAGIDVFEPEPAPPDHRPVHASNVVLSAYLGGVTSESARRIMMAAVTNLMRLASGEQPEDVVV